MIFKCESFVNFIREFTRIIYCGPRYQCRMNNKCGVTEVECLLNLFNQIK